MKKLLAPLRYVLFLLAGAGMLWLTFRHQSFGEVWDKLKHADFFWLGVSVILAILALISRTLRWVQLVEAIGYQPRNTTTYHSLMFGYLANLAVPRLGEVSRCGALNKSDDIPFDKLIGTVIVERVSDVLMLLVCMALVAILEFDRLGGFMREHFLNPVLAKIDSSPLLIVALLVIGLAGIGAVIYLFRMKNPPAFIEKMILLVRGILQGLNSVRLLKNKWLFVFHSLFIWAIYWFMTWVCFLALPATTGLSLSTGLFVMMLGAVGMTAPVQGGIGVYHLLVSQGLLLFGLSETDGIVFATMVHTTQTLMMIVLGAISMVILFFFTKKRTSQPHGTPH